MPLKNNTHKICKQKIPRTKKNKDYYSRPLYSSHTTQPPPHQQQPTQAITSTKAATRINTTVHHPRHPTACQHNKQTILQPTQHNNTPSHNHAQPPSVSSTQSHTTLLHPDLQINNNKHQPVNAGKIKLLRKEVIQPHLPVRLPCYDFVPIADPTFDHSPQKTGWAMGFGCYQLS